MKTLWDRKVKWLDQGEKAADRVGDNIGTESDRKPEIQQPCNIYYKC